MYLRLPVSVFLYTSHTFIDLNLPLISLSTVAFAQVDWHDFVVVETVDFKDSETGWYFLVTV